MNSAISPFSSQSGLREAALDLGALPCSQSLSQKSLADVRDEIAEAVNVEDFAHEPAFLQLRLMHFETHWIVDLGSEGVGRLLQRQPRSRRREEVAAMERRADRAQEVLLGRQLAGLGLRVRSGDGAEEPVVERQQVIGARGDQQ